jgi:Mg2+-importing ATPase
MASKNKNKLRRYHSRLSSEQNDKLLAYAKKSNNEIFDEFNTSIHGLTTDRYEKYKEQYGLNLVGNKKIKHWYNHLIEAFFNPFSIILIIIAILNLATV